MSNPEHYFKSLGKVFCKAPYDFQGLRIKGGSYPNISVRQEVNRKIISFTSYGTKNSDGWVMVNKRKIELTPAEVEKIVLYDEGSITNVIPVHWTGCADKMDGVRKFRAFYRLGITLPDKTKNKISKSLKNNKNRIGKTHTQTTKKKISKANSGENHPQFGIPKSNKTKNRMRKKLAGQPKTETHKENMKKGWAKRNAKITAEEDQRTPDQLIAEMEKQGRIINTHLQQLKNRKH